MTPKDFEYAVDAYNDKLKQTEMLEDMHIKHSEYIAWLTGLYVRSAVASVLGGRKATPYPMNPLTERKKEISEIAKANNRDEEEMRAELLVMQLEVGAANARIAKLANNYNGAD